MCFLSWNFREPERLSCFITKISIWANHYPAVFILFNRYTKIINVWWTEFRRKDKKQFSVFRYHNYTIQKTAFFRFAGISIFYHSLSINQKMRVCSNIWIWKKFSHSEIQNERLELSGIDRIIYKGGRTNYMNMVLPPL